MKTQSSRYSVTVMRLTAGKCRARYTDTLTEAIILAATALNAEPGATVTVASI